MFLINFVKKNFSPKMQGRIKVLLSAYRLFLSRLRGGVYRGINIQQNIKPRVLFYDINGLSYAGTQKNLQILAKHLDKNKYEVFFMFSSKNHEGRKKYLENAGVTLVDFNYTSMQKDLPFFITDMTPHIFDVLKDNHIDLLVVAGSGYPEFPTANITKLPIIFINVFGSVNIQTNINKHVCMSHLLEGIISKCIPREKIEVLYIPSEGPIAGSFEQGRELRSKLGLTENDIIFGRIGRPDDNIFDPIGIRAFQKVVKDFPEAHYLIMAPPPVLEKIVRSENIPNVYFLPPSSDEGEVWAFHQALDVMAHFRYDGETCGLNIAESMLCGKPIISHKSPIWNAHLEYLDHSFSRVAEIGDTDGYAAAMLQFIEFKRNGKIIEMGRMAKEKAEELFYINSNIGKFERWVGEVLK